MKPILVFMTAILILAALSISAPADGKNCKKSYRCVPTATSARITTPPPGSYVSGIGVRVMSINVGSYRGYLCQYPGDLRWYVCQPVRVTSTTNGVTVTIGYGWTPKP